MKNSKKILGASVLSLGLMLLVGTTASAYQGDPKLQGPNFTPERHAEMTAIFESGDYEAFAALMAENPMQGRMMERVNAENFDTFVKVHNLALAGDLEGARELRAELGLGLRDGSGQGRRMRSGNGRGAGMGQGLKDGSGQGFAAGRGGQRGGGQGFRPDVCLNQ